MILYMIQVDSDVSVYFTGQCIKITHKFIPTESLCVCGKDMFWNACQTTTILY